MVQHRSFALVPYDPGWARTFEESAQIVKRIFGDQLVAIHHIGSTSVPGMLAKPQVDLMAVVKDIDAVEDFYTRMAEAGFESLGRNYTRGPNDEYFVKNDADGTRLVSIHTYQEGHPNIYDTLVFRDYLRAHDSARQEYIDLKKALYAKYAGDYPAYRSGKYEPIEDMKKRARAWDKAGRGEA